MRHRKPLLLHAEVESDLDETCGSDCDPRSHATWAAARPPRFETAAAEAIVSAMFRAKRANEALWANATAPESAFGVHIVHMSSTEALPIYQRVCCPSPMFLSLAVSACCCCPSPMLVSLAVVACCHCPSLAPDSLAGGAGCCSRDSHSVFAVRASDLCLISCQQHQVGARCRRKLRGCPSPWTPHHTISHSAATAFLRATPHSRQCLPFGMLQTSTACAAPLVRALYRPRRPHTCRHCRACAC